MQVHYNRVSIPFGLGPPPPPPLIPVHKLDQMSETHRSLVMRSPMSYSSHRVFVKESKVYGNSLNGMSAVGSSHMCTLGIEKRGRGDDRGFSWVVTGKQCSNFTRQRRVYKLVSNSLVESPRSQDIEITARLFLDRVLFTFYHNHIMASTTTIQVVREYLQDTPKVYSAQLAGNPQTKQDIAEQLLSVSLSSPHLGSYTFDINQPQSTTIVRHNRPSHDRFMVCLSSLPECLTQLLQDAHEALRQLQKQVAYLQKKDEERDEKEKEWDRNEEKTLEWGVFSRIAQGMWVSQVT